jgi:hypothetical protein
MLQRAPFSFVVGPRLRSPMEESQAETAERRIQSILRLMHLCKKISNVVRLDRSRSNSASAPTRLIVHISLLLYKVSL